MDFDPTDQWTGGKFTRTDDNSMQIYVTAVITNLLYHFEFLHLAWDFVWTMIMTVTSIIRTLMNYTTMSAIKMDTRHIKTQQP